MSGPAWLETAHDVTGPDALRALYAAPAGASLAKEADHVHPVYRPFIAASPWLALATVGPHGPDISPRGDAPGFVEVADPHTLLLPDRRGNNRLDSLRHIAVDPRVSLLFLVPGHPEALRVLGTARISTHPELLARCAVDGKAPCTVLVIAVRTVFFQCGRAVLRSGLWDASQQVAPGTVPSAGRMLEALGRAGIDAATYDAGLRDRQRSTLY